MAVVDALHERVDELIFGALVHEVGDPVRAECEAAECHGVLRVDGQLDDGDRRRFHRGTCGIRHGWLRLEDHPQRSLQSGAH